MSETNKQVITRIAPSPTGFLHIGTARTALFNYLYAKHYEGKFVIRIEDTDKARSTKEFEKDILDSLDWLGLTADNIERQSERTEIYKKYLNKIIENGGAYISKEEGGERSEVIRLKNPNKKITFRDELRGDITFDTTELGDFVIAKSLEESLYHFAVVVDDYEMGITHVIRGEDGISNTPRQILIQEACGFERPVYVHLPFILGEDKSKLSKRHGATSLVEFKNKGYMKEAVINYLAMLGWNPKTDEEIFSMKELIERFDTDGLNKPAAVFTYEKLNWYNRHYIKQIPKEVLYTEMLSRSKKASSLDKDVFEKIVELSLERSNTLAEIAEQIDGEEFLYVFEKPKLDLTKISWKTNSPEITKKHLEEIKKIISDLDVWSKEEIKNTVWSYVEKNGKGDVLWPFRYSLTGKEKSPEPFTVSEILGKEKTLEYLENAISFL